jgi:GTP-binding protein
LAKKRIHTLFETIALIKKESQIKVNTNLLNNVIAKAFITNPPPKHKNGRVKVSFATQVKSQIPTFTLFCNNPEYLHFTYTRYIENQIRSAFGITHVPITVY